MHCISKMKNLSDIYINTENYKEDEYPITEASINAILENHINTRYRNLCLIYNYKFSYKKINISKGLIERIISIAESNTKTQFEYTFRKLVKVSKFYFYYERPDYDFECEISSLFRYKIPYNLQ